jgi:hypothetical protein
MPRDNLLKNFSLAFLTGERNTLASPVGPVQNRAMSVPGPMETIRELIAAASVNCVDPAINSNLEVSCDSLFSGMPAVETAAGSLVVAAAERLSGHKSGTVAFGTEAGAARP